MYKHDLEFEKNLNFCKHKINREQLTQLTLSSHNTESEIGWHNRVPREREIYYVNNVK
jgi:hypothetical protein